MLTDADIARRKPVWIALAALWLDTELREPDLQHIASILRASGYSVEQLQEIYFYEVAPVVYPNLLSVAGAWSGFDAEWLVAEAENQANNHSARHRLALRLKKPLMTYDTENHWHRLVALLRGEALT